MHWRITDGQKVSIFCVCGGALSLVGRNNKSAGKGSTNVQRSENTNTNENAHKNTNTFTKEVQLRNENNLISFVFFFFKDLIRFNLF